MISAASLSPMEALILGGATTPDRSVMTPANSGNSDNGFQSPAPSAQALVCPSTRPSAIHLRTRSAGTGPYSFRSAPMILYIVVLRQPENTRAGGKVAGKSGALPPAGPCAGGRSQAGVAATSASSFSPAFPSSIRRAASSQPSTSDFVLPATNNAAAALISTASRLGPRSL